MCADALFLFSMRQSILILGLFGILLELSPAIAQSRPDVRKMSCAQVQDTIAKAGGIVLTTGNQTFERFVASRDNCMVGEIMRRDTVKAADGNCSVNRCKQRRSRRD